MFNNKKIHIPVIAPLINIMLSLFLSHTTDTELRSVVWATALVTRILRGRLKFGAHLQFPYKLLISTSTYLVLTRRLAYRGSLSTINWSKYSPGALSLLTTASSTERSGPHRTSESSRRTQMPWQHGKEKWRMAYHPDNLALRLILSPQATLAKKIGCTLATFG